jgi:hypothetical protein
MNNKEYILDKITNSEVSNDPWKHLIIKDFLPLSFYEGIKEETERYVDKKEIQEAKNKGVRAYHVSINKSVGVFPHTTEEPYLSEYYNILLDRDIENAIKEKVFLEGYHKNTPSVDMYGTFDVMTSGFTYDEVHPDHENKMITMIHYLANPGDDESLGTLLYSPYKQGFEQSVTKDILSSAPYIPNCVLFFAPCWKENHISNHSMMHNSKTTVFRRTIQNFYLRKESDWTKPQKGRLKI